MPESLYKSFAVDALSCAWNVWYSLSNDFGESKIVWKGVDYLGTSTVRGRHRALPLVANFFFDDCSEKAEVRWDIKSLLLIAEGCTMEEEWTRQPGVSLWTLYYPDPSVLLCQLLVILPSLVRDSLTFFAHCGKSSPSLSSTSLSTIITKTVVRWSSLLLDLFKEAASAPVEGSSWTILHSLSRHEDLEFLTQEGFELSVEHSRLVPARWVSFR